MAETSDLTASKLFDVKDFVCVVTGGGMQNLDLILRISTNKSLQAAELD